MKLSAHPVAMFEIMADDQSKVIDFYHDLFGWKINYNEEGFGYINFPTAPPAQYATLGGIGKAKPDVPGWEKGTAFYISVECVTETLERVVELGGAVILERTPVDGYVFGMFNDVEGNLIGLLEPFDQGTA